MEKIDFIKKLVALYENNAVIDPNNHPQVIRGRGRTVSSETEDLFGIYVSELLGAQYQVYVDIRISIDGVNDFFPDIAICKDGVILQMWDLKMDLGWMRGKLWSMIDKNRTLIAEIKDRQINNNSKFVDPKPLVISKDITYNFAIITLCNGGKDSSKVYDYAMNKITDDRCMENETSKVFFIFKHRSLRKTDPSFQDDDYHPNWRFFCCKDKADPTTKLEFDLKAKMSHGTFNELEQFILALKQ